MRVIVADDALLFREGLTRVLASIGFEVLGVAGDGEEAVRLVGQDPPDVAVLDLRMPPGHGTEGLEAAVRIRERWPSVGVLLLSQYVEAHYALRLMTEFEGGVGYLLKDRVSALESFGQDLRRVAAGETVIDPELVSLLVARRREEDPLGALSERERDVLSLMAQGLSNVAMAETLFLSTKTIEANVSSIFTKLGLAPDARDHRRVLAVLTFLRGGG
ncbi:response regulator transcription factor [Nocardioides aestuarii]|uniref:Response regulator n=1 Tax=Nocardioides aestuarii TaxID=252231 RepID=A0ABW4TJG4_9ACTN